MISAVEGFGQLEAEQLSKWVRLRNIVTHEYLDIKWSSISKFINAILAYPIFFSFQKLLN
jgi:uncharacterized protein YutE (UPF0331/DUF86 family)